MRFAVNKRHYIRPLFLFTKMSYEDTTALSSVGNGSPNHALQPFFGSVDPQYQKMLAEDKFAHETYNLPKAYEGKNKHLETVLDYLVTEEDSWYTRSVLPWVLTDDLSVKWDIFRFNKTLMDLEPHQGVPRYVTAERESRSDRLVRRGLAFIIEHGFYKTDQGRQHYLMNLRQIVDSVNETAYHGVIHALLSSKNHYKEWERQHGSVVTRPGQLLRQQRRRWAVVQKQERGLYILDAELKDQMKYEGVRPDVWILPSKMSIYVTMVPSAEVEFYRKGSGAAANLEKGPDNLLTFRGSKVFETRPFDIDFIGEPRDLLVRERQIGEYFVFPNSDEVGDANEQRDGTSNRDIFIYSMDDDDFIRMRYSECLAKAKENAEAVNAMVREAGDDEVPFDTDRPGTVLLLRPFQTYNMASAVLMKGGLDTGFTAHGHHDFMLTDDVIHKVHIGHYTFYHKSIVKQPKNIIIAEDVFAHSYVSGEGSSLFAGGVTDEESFAGQLAQDSFSSDIIPLFIQPRTVDEDGNVTYGSGRVKYANPMDITGHYSPQTLDLNNSTLNNSQEHYTNADLYSQALGFDRLQNYGNADQFLSPIRNLNTVCFQGHQLSYNPKSESFSKITLNTGHWGPNVYPGCRSVRNGENAFLKDMEYEKHRIKGQLS